MIISPIFSGQIIQQMFDNGSIYSMGVLDITELTLQFLEGVWNVTIVFLQTG